MPIPKNNAHCYVKNRFFEVNVYFDNFPKSVIPPLFCICKIAIELLLRLKMLTFEVVFLC